MYDKWATCHLFSSIPFSYTSHFPPETLYLFIHIRALNEIPPLQLKFFRRPVNEVPEEIRQIPQSRLKLYRGSEDAGLYVSSPFVTKIEFRLRLAGIPYALDAGAPWLGPKGKIPYMEVAPEKVEEKAIMLGDSALIIQHLVGNKSVGDLNAHLKPADKARDLALRSLLEDKLYFYHVRTVLFLHEHS